MKSEHRPPEARRHHAVPRLLLKGFAVERKRGKFQTQVFDKQTERTYASPIEDVMVERDFNAVEIKGRRVSLEDYLGLSEGRAAPIIQRIIQEASLGGLTDADRTELAKFVALQFVRGTGVRAMFEDSSKQLAREIEKRGFPVAGQLDFTADQVKAHGLLSITKDLPEYAAAMAMKDLLLFRAPDGAEFILGDNPVALANQEPAHFYGNLGLACKGIQIYLPLSAEFCLALWCPTHREKIEDGIATTRARLGALKAYAVLGAKPIKAQPDILRLAEAALADLEPVRQALKTGDAYLSSAENMTFVNSLQVMHAERFLVSRTGQFHLPREMLGHHESYRAGRRMQVG